MKEKTGLFIIGAYRDFYKNGDNFERFLEFLSIYKEIVIFAFLSDTSEYQRWHTDVFRNMNISFHRNKNKLNNELLIEKIEKYKLKYFIKYYNSTEDLIITKDDKIINDISYKGKKNRIDKSDTFLYQMLLERRCYQMMREYEDNNSVKITRVIKTRPDIFYKDNFFVDKFIDCNIFIRDSDLFYICPRHIFDKLITKIEYMDFNEYQGFKITLYKKIMDLADDKGLKYNKEVDVNHDFNMIFLDILGIKSEKYKLTNLIRQIK